MKKAFVLCGLIFGALALSLIPATSQPTAAQGGGLKPEVVRQAGFIKTAPLRSFKPKMTPRTKDAPPIRSLDKGRSVKALNGADGAIQRQAKVQASSMPTPLLGFAGISSEGSLCFCLPPDTNGDVGPNNYVQFVNGGFAFWDKSGHLLWGPIEGNTPWLGMNNPCATTNDGDIIVLYDRLANRWLLSQFANVFTTGPFYQCIAVSQTGDPLGGYNAYAFQWSTSILNDYPKFGVWPDGYYFTANQFQGTTFDWAGTGVAVFDRTAMLNGDPAAMIKFNLPFSDWGGMLPANFNGATNPPANEPNYFAEIQDHAWDPVNIPTDRIQVWAFHADFATPSNSTFTNIANLNVAPFDGILCGFSENCIKQKGTTRKVDALGDRGMYRLQYRNFGSYATLVFNHTVDVGGDQAGVRWYELHVTGGTPTINQQGTFAPNGISRWMGSAALDKNGNLAVGYSTSSANKYPGIKYAGRLATDPPGLLSQGEATLVFGFGSQTHMAGRWGDYSSLSVDPSDDCTFWYTNEYYLTTSKKNWQTWIGSFKFPSCS